jgi:uncharacterized membrane protein
MVVWLKVLHIVAVVLFLGNIITGVFWHRHASRTRDPHLLARTVEGVIRSDRLFTMPGVFVIIVTGVLMAMQLGLPLLKTGWITWSLVLFAISGLLFGTQVAPLQRKLLALAQAGSSKGSFDYDAYHRIATRWEVAGTIATLTPLAALVLMVMKPAL